VWAERGFLFKPELHLDTQSVPRSKHTASRLTKTIQLLLYREIMAVCSEIHTNTAVWAERRFLFKPKLHLNTQSVPRSKHSVSVTKTIQLLLNREIMAVCSEIHTNTLCGQNVEL